MSNSVSSPIQLEAISKCYRIFQNPQDRFKQALLDRLPKTLSNSESPYYREHWALRDVSFELQAGEAVGILGRNGAGKSTLLQIIAGTLEPTSGEVITRGRITALLELGSGFNPEFTGRENVLLNAQILGMTQDEVLARFDDIASFADIGDFIDQPVKTYSSGMMMRLAFAVQTAVEPKVLIVDEALSVGDMFFQAKCMARIRKLVDQGVTLLFVSHDVSAVKQICNRALLLHSGNQVALDSTQKVADEYMRMQIEDRNQISRDKYHAAKVLESGQYDEVNFNLSESRASVDQNSSFLNSLTESQDVTFGMESFSANAHEGRVGTQWARIRNVQMLRQSIHTTEFDFDDEAEIRVLVTFDLDLSNVNLTLKVRTLQGVDILFFDTRLQEKLDFNYLGNNTYLLKWKVRLRLMHGNYFLTVGIAQPPEVPGNDCTFIDMVIHAYHFKMEARAKGMIGGFVAPQASLDITCLSLGEVKDAI